MSKKILLVSFTFPPSPGVGGRRWAKFSKYLYRKGYDLRVISNEVWKTEQSNWDHDVRELEGRVTRIPSGYPKQLNVFNQSLFDKVKYRIALELVKFRSQGSYFDRSIFWRNNLQKSVIEHLERGYTTVIVTCAPYRSALFLCELKLKYPKLRLIIDLRDPWDMKTTLYGFSSLSQKRKNYEMKIQGRVMRTADKVISVYDYMTENYKRKYPEQSGKFFSLDNGFDPEDFTSVPAITHREKSDEIKFLFAGSFYQGAEHILEDFTKSLDRIRDTHPEIYTRLQFNFYGKKPEFFDKLTSNHKNTVVHGGTIPLKDVYQKIAESDFMTLFLLDEMNYSLSTKFYEYISQNKPVVIFAKGGDAGRFVEDNKLGYFADFGQVENTLLQLVKDRDNGVVFSPEKEIDTTQFSIPHLTDRLIEIIES